MSNKSVDDSTKWNFLFIFPWFLVHAKVLTVFEKVWVSNQIWRLLAQPYKHQTFLASVAAGIHFFVFKVKIASASSAFIQSYSTLAEIFNTRIALG